MATLELEAEWLDILRPLADRPLEGFVKELAVLELYRRRQLSSGKAAELLKMSRVEFIRYASRLGIAFFDMSEAELADELDHLQTLQ